VVDARFVNEVVRVCEFVHGSDLTEIEEESKHNVLSDLPRYALLGAR